MTFSRLPILLCTLFLLLLLTACGGGDSSTSDSKQPPTEGDTLVARDNSATTTANNAVKIDVLANDTGSNSGPYDVHVATKPAKGAVSVNSQSDVVTYTPNEGVTGNDSFKYTFTNSKGVRSNQATVTIAIKSGAAKPPSDETPIARDDSATKTANNAVKIDVLANDTGRNNGPYKVKIVTKPAKGSVSVNSQSNIVTYTPNKGATGSDSFKYTFSNSKAVSSNQATVTISDNCPAIHPNENYLAIGDSLTTGVDDDFSSDNVTADGCYKGKGYPPVLIDKLNSAKGRKHKVINKGVNGAESIDGVRSVGGLMGGESMHVLVMYGTNDSRNAATGNAVDVSDFRENMQDIVNRILRAGKSVYLAKIPPVLGDDNDGEKYSNLDQGARNKMIRQYNTVIGKLVNPGRHIHLGPDFYSFFKGKPDLYSDNYHFTGRGYREMAKLWSQKL